MTDFNTNRLVRVSLLVVLSLASGGCDRPAPPTTAPKTTTQTSAPPAATGAPSIAETPTIATTQVQGQPEGKDEFPASYYLSFYLGNPEGHQAIRTSHRPLEGNPAPPLDIKTWIGEPVDLASLKGKVVVVDFWATWCGPCLRAIPHNLDLLKKHAGEGLIVVGVHDSGNGWDSAPQVVKARQIIYSVGLDDAGKSTAAWHVQFWPTYGVIDRKGVLRAVGVAPDALEPIVAKLVAEPS